MTWLSQKLNINSSLLAALTLPLVVLVLMENCSKMKADGGMSAFSSNDPNICSSIYDPPANLTSKATHEDDLQTSNHAKNYLDDDGLSAALVSKAVSNLKNQKIIVVIDSSCSPAPDSLSAKARAQNAGDQSLQFENAALLYEISEDIDMADLEAQAEADDCVVSFHRDGKLKTASLSLPSIDDTHASKLTYLTALHFIHAYENLITKQSAGIKVKVAFLDTGINCTHPDLAANMVTGCGFDAVSAGQPVDNDGHGSHTAGMVGAIVNNGTGIAGIGGNNLEIHAIRVIDGSQGSVNDAYAGIQKAIELDVDVINISLESQERLTLIENGVKAAVNAGIVVIMAAGNHGAVLGTDVDVSPALVGAELKGAITVGSIDEKSGFLSSFSNYGNKVEIATIGAIDAAMGSGGGLYSTNKTDTYHRLMGTSQAAPIVTGAAALAIHFLKQKGKAYTPADIEKILMASTFSAPVGISGGRVLNLSKLVRSVNQFANTNLCADRD